MARQTLGVIIGNRDFFPDVARRRRRGRDVLALFESTRASSACCSASTRPSSAPSRPGQHAKALRRPLPAAPRPDRRRAGLPAELRRREGRGRHAEARRAGRARAGAGLPGRPRSSCTSSGAATRSAARSRSATTCSQYGIPFSLTERHTRARRLAGVPRRTREVPRRLPRRERAAGRADRRDRRAAERVQHHALQREAPAGVRHQRQHARPVRGARGRAAA